MKRVCAWCNKLMSPVKTGSSGTANQVTHSICPDCANNLDFQLGVSLTTYLDSLAMPIVALDGNDALIGVNRAAVALYREKAVIDPVKWQEKIYECAHARLPHGCEKRVHCSGCAIRMITNATFASGKSSLNVPANLHLCSAETTEKADMLISAEKIENIIFLKIVRL